MIISIFESDQETEDFFSERLSDHELRFVQEPLSADNAADHKDADVVVVFIYSDVAASLIDTFTDLKAICTRSTGFDHIDVAHCHEKSIPVCNVPHYGENTVAEHTFALLLSISRRIPESLERVQKGSFDATGLRGFDLKGRTIGVIGAGSIGRHVIRMARGFEMRVLAYDPFPRQELEAELGFSYVPLIKLLEQSDVITLHCPYSESTHHLLNKDNLEKIKPGAVLINTARGALVDSDSLLSALADGRIAAAGIDVLEEEASIREEAELLSDRFKQQANLRRALVDHVLLRHPRVVVTPHSAFNSAEAIERILETTADNIDAVAAQAPTNTV